MVRESILIECLLSSVGGSIKWEALDFWIMLSKIFDWSSPKNNSTLIEALHTTEIIKGSTTHNLDHSLDSEVHRKTLSRLVETRPGRRTKDVQNSFQRRLPPHPKAGKLISILHVYFTEQWRNRENPYTTLNLHMYVHERYVRSAAKIDLGSTLALYSSFERSICSAALNEP